MLKPRKPKKQSVLMEWALLKRIKKRSHPQAIEDAQWVTATTQFGWSSRKPEQYQQQLNAEDFTGLASKNYCALLYEEKMMMKKGLGDCFENTLAL